MIYQVLFTYDDDKTVRVLTSEEQLNSFLNDIRAGKIHKDPNTNAGFWTSYEQLRHIIIQPVKEQENEGSNGSNENLSQGTGVFKEGKDTV